MKNILALSVVFLFSWVSLADAGVKTEEIEYSHNGTKLTGFMAYDDSAGKSPGVLVVHEWWGHNDHARNRAEMLAEAGYTAFALDMYGDGKLANHPKKAGEFMNAAFINGPNPRRDTTRPWKFLKIIKQSMVPVSGQLDFVLEGQFQSKWPVVGQT